MKIEIKPYDKHLVGKKIRDKRWKDAEWFEIEFVGEKRMMVRNMAGNECFLDICGDWELYKGARKPVKMAPALVFYTLTQYYSLTPRLFASEEEARRVCAEHRNSFIRWPARENEWYEVDE